MLLLPNFRLPTLIHTRSANAKWLYEISHKNPVWMHPSDAQRARRGDAATWCAWRRRSATSSTRSG